MRLEFPKGFLWGAATSAHQVEGGNRNDWSEWEKATHHEQSGLACDHYNRFREDFDIAKSLGHNAHRFSIEWSRIEPEEGKWNEKEIAHYQEVVNALRERGIEPFVTLWHCTLPLWVARQGGWENQKIIDDFARYINKICRSSGFVDVKFWIPINEPSVYTGHSYVIGAFPPQVKSFIRANKVLKNLLAAHKRAYKIIHNALGDKVMVGSAHNVHYHVPKGPRNILDILAAQFFNYIRDVRPLKSITGFSDFIGLNYYYRDTIKFVGYGGRFGPIDIQNPNEWTSDRGWDIYPEGIYHVLKDLKKYNKPIYITENGVADARDVHREKFIKEHLRWVHKAIAEGVDVRGYFYWSLLDNFEWDKGFWPRFGLVEVDYKTMERRVRQSAWEYAKIAKENVL